MQSTVDRHYPWLVTSAFRTWAARFGGLLMQQEMEFWYEQFLGKPPSTGTPTPWHQDEAYWGRTLRDRGVTCWTAFHSVGPQNGCMHFVRGGHKRLLQHRNPPPMASDLLVCELPQDADIVVCPIEAGHGDVPSQQDAAHDDGKLVGRLAPRAHPALPQSCVQGASGRQLFLAGPCEATDGLTRRGPQDLGVSPEVVHEGGVHLRFLFGQRGIAEHDDCHVPREGGIHLGFHAGIRAAMTDAAALEFPEQSGAFPFSRLTLSGLFASMYWGLSISAAEAGCRIRAPSCCPSFGRAMKNRDRSATEARTPPSG